MHWEISIDMGMESDRSISIVMARESDRSIRKSALFLSCTPVKQAGFRLDKRICHIPSVQRKICGKY